MWQVHQNILEMTTLGRGRIVWEIYARSNFHLFAFLFSLPIYFSQPPLRTLDQNNLNSTRRHEKQQHQHKHSVSLHTIKTIGSTTLEVNHFECILLHPHRVLFDRHSAPSTALHRVAGPSVKTSPASIIWGRRQLSCSWDIQPGVAV